MLDFIEKRRGPADDRYGWSPFGNSDEFNPSWWHHLSYDETSYTWFEVRRDGLEVARIELDSTVSIGHYLGTPELGAAALEIQFIEVQ